jgi:mannose-1-phosphate guanylyltransferase
VSAKDKKITLIGVEPTYPATGLGYIERDGAIDPDSGAYNVESFKEKPDFAMAQKYGASGKYLWNCGYFVGSVNIFLDAMKQDAPDLYATFDSLASIAEIGSAEYNETYLALDSQPIDTALIEKAKGLAVVSATFDWIDVGSFKDLHEVVERDQQGNYFNGEGINTLDVDNIYVRNEEANKPIAVIGLDNVIVVNTAEGILIARKDVSQRVGEIAKKLQV